MGLPDDMIALDGSDRFPPEGSERIHAADPTVQMSVTISVRRSPGGPSDSRRVRREDFSKNYGATQADLEKVAAYVRKNGLTVVRSNPERRTVVVSGTVEQMNRAFSQDLGVWEQPDGERYRGRDGKIYIPRELTGIVRGIFGLDNRRLGRPDATAAASPASLAAQLDPTDVARLYRFPSNRADGQTIGILAFGGFSPSDVKNYFDARKLTTPNIVFAAPGMNQPANDLDRDREILMDICIAGSIAQGAQIAIYRAQSEDDQGWLQAISRAIHPLAGEPQPTVFSISAFISVTDDPGVSVSASFMDELSALFQDASLLDPPGPTIFVSSGDDGAFAVNGHVSVQYPASDPFVTACGGTVISNVTGSSFTEGTWPSSGGGVSAHFPVPDYQKGAGLTPRSNNPGNAPGRGVPDVSGFASAGYPMRDHGGSFLGGQTSAVAPLYAGLIAVINAKRGEPVGFLNPRLYVIGSSVARDINDSVSNDGALGYKSVSGWDAVTGWGSLDGTALFNLL